LAVHPTQEELLMTGSDGGLLIMWNLRTKQVLQKFLQYGVYSIDANLMDNPLDGKWSPDGKAFVTGNNYGTISFFSCEGKNH
jgi:WD40 repeat protein